MQDQSVDDLTVDELIVRLGRISQWSPEDGRDAIDRMQLARRIKRHIERGDGPAWIKAGRALLRAIAGKHV